MLRPRLDIGPGSPLARISLYTLAALILISLIPSHASLSIHSERSRLLLRAPANAASDDGFTRQRRRMVLEQIQARGVSDRRVLEAMASVPRHLFVPAGQAREAYQDRPLPIGFGQTISQPYIVALMTELLELSKEQKVLEIGTGSGYQAAVLSLLAKDVYTIEIVEELGRSAEERLKRLGYSGVKVRTGDGYYGWREAAPFDAVMVTAAADHIPPPLIEQLRSGGRMVIPVGSPFQTQNLLLLTKDINGKLKIRNIAPVRFVPLIRREE